MAIKINDDSMAAVVDGAAIAAATKTDEGWIASTWSEPLDRNRAITAMVLAERLASGASEDDPHVTAWREELSRG